MIMHDCVVVSRGHPCPSSPNDTVHTHAPLLRISPQIAPYDARICSWLASPAPRKPEKKSGFEMAAARVHGAFVFVIVPFVENGEGEGEGIR